MARNKDFQFLANFLESPISVKKPSLVFFVIFFDFICKLKISDLICFILFIVYLFVFYIPNMA